MASKKFKNKTCVYCGEAASSETADHVIAREFFPLDARDNLPKVPACRDCNNEKSQLEHYVLAVLPLGGMHAGAPRTIADQVMPRLAKNAALQRTLFGEELHPDFRWPESGSVPFEPDNLASLACYLALGLAWHHWHLQLAPSAIANARSFTIADSGYFEDTLNSVNAGSRIESNWGDGVFSYRAVAGRANPKVTLWQMTFFGGVELADSEKGGKTSRTLFVATDDDPQWIAALGGRRANGRAPISLE